MRIAITHISEYRYDGPAGSAVQALRLTPAPVKGQTLVSWKVEAPGIDSACSYTDGFGNLVHLVSPPADSTVVRIAATGVVETTDTGGVSGWTGEAAAAGAFLRSTPMTTADTAIEAMAEAVRSDDRLATLHALMDAVSEHVAYEPGSTHAQTTAAAAFDAKRGVCQDHAHIFIAASRFLRIPARYVTGYLLLEDGAEAPAHHAWAEAYVDDLGWVGFDAANCLCPTDRYVRLGAGLDAASAAPIRGVRRMTGEESLTVDVDVQAVGQGQSQSQSQSGGSQSQQ